MADTQAIIEVKAIGTEKAGKQFTQFENTVTRSMTASESSVARSFSRMAAQYLSMAYVMNKATKLMSSGVEFNKFVENQTMSFSVMMKSAEKAKAQMKDLYDFAVNSPLTFKETAGSAKQLMAYGFAAKELIPTMKMLGSVAIATGHKLDDISYVYGTLRSQGRAYSRDLMQFGMRGIPIYEELAKVMGVNASQIQKMASQGKIGFKEVEQAFMNMTTGSGKFSGIIEGYMETLTGKLSMLSDIWEQLSGVLTEDTFGVLKEYVEEVTKIIQTDKFRKDIADLGKSIGKFARIVGDAFVLIINNIPLITTLVKLFIATKIFSLLGQLPATLMKLAGVANTAANGIFAVFLNGNGSLVAPLISGIDGVGFALTRLSKLAFAFVKANPLLMLMVAALTAGIALGQFLDNYYEKINDMRRTSPDEATRKSQLEFDYDPVRMAGAGKVIANSFTALFGKDIIAEQIKPEQIEEIAKKYNMTAGAAANALVAIKALSKEQWNFYLSTKSAAKGMDEYLARMNAIQNPRTSMKIQQEFLNSLTGLGEERYVDIDNIAKGKLGAKDYIDGFADQMEKKKKVFQEAFTPKMNDQLLQDEYDALVKALDAGALIEKLFDKTQFDETIRARLKELEKLLDSSGKKAKAITSLPKLDKWWLPEDSAVAATLTAIDDVTLASEKAIYNAQKEIDARREIMIVNRDATKNIIDANEWQIKLNNLLIEEGQIRADIAKANKRAIGNTKYTEQTQGNAGFFDDLRTKAAEAFEKGYKQFAEGNVSGGIASNLKGMGFAAAASIEGTEVGGLVSGGNPFAMAIIAIAEFVMSMESVQKVLNPFKTVLEQTRDVVEPMVTGILEPMTNVLEMSGDLLKQILAPILGIMKILNVLTYVLETWVFVPLQILGEGFKWFYNSIIVTVGNWIITIVNAIIGVLNKIPFVHIKYISTLKKVSDAVEDFSQSLSNGTNALSATIDYLSAKLRGMYDSQLDSLQELYEVGAITATKYEEQVKNLQETMLDMDDPLVSLSDQQLSIQEDILQRLYELYALQDIVNSETLSDEDLTKILGEHGITTKSLEATMMSAITKSLGAIDQQKAEADVAKAAEEARKAAEAAARLAAEVAAAKLASAKEQVTGYGTSLAKAVTRKDMKMSLIADYQLAKFQEDLAAVVARSASLTSPEAVAALFTAFKERWKNYISDSAFEAAGVSYDVGTSQVPKDMLANIHKDEGIIPKTFMDSIRSGELTLGGRNQASGQTTVININIEGTVVAENDLVESISGTLYKMRSKGLVTV